MFRKIMIVSLLSALSGCTYIYGDKGVIKNRDTDYMAAKSVPPLIIPPGLSSSTIQEHYPVSYRNYPGSTNKVNLTPPELSRARPVVTQPKTTVTQVASTTTSAPQHKQRYLSDVAKHPEYLMQSLYPNKSATTTQSKVASTTTTAQQPVKQAENTAPVKKKKYIVDYFR